MPLDCKGNEVDWEVYLVRCADNSLYCGIAKDVKTRIALHNQGKGSKYTKSRRPVKLVASSRKMTRSDALKLEYHVKQLPINEKVSALMTERNPDEKKSGRGAER